ncbi:MAG: hypothetical protein IJ841_11990 [Prevotella sp.]|nr:hypothetical protein [Prevotella sp.]
MKRLLLLLLLVAGTTGGAYAQEVYTQIRQKAVVQRDDQFGSDVVRQIGHFKVNALDYMAMKMKEQMPDSTASFLDKQALAMNSYVSLYVQTLIEMKAQPANYQVKVMKLFIDASVSNPLFNDRDQELVMGYVADGNSLTRFSLDTDWQRALLAVDSELKKMAKQ